MKIGIDARLVHETGIGRYIRNLISELSVIDTENTYCIFVTSGRNLPFMLPNSRWYVKTVDAHWHSLKEQLVLPKIANAERLDLLHIPYFNIPILYTGTMIVTMHDVTTLRFPTGKASTLHPFLYGIKLFCLKILLSIGLRKAAHIISVSETTKKDLIRYFFLPPGKVSVTYEGIDNNIKKHSGKKAKPIINGQYVLYVGNAYPHKNLNTLIDAFLLVLKIHPGVKLVFAGPEDFFYVQIKKRIQDLSAHSSFLYYGYADDETLHNLYAYASVLAFPSLSEGFGLPALEALLCGTPVACSDIPVFHEILNGYVRYYSPDDCRDMARIISSTIESGSTLPPAAISELSGKFNWNKMARDTLEIYKKSVYHSI